jgi:hypothetical protein
MRPPGAFFLTEKKTNRSGRTVRRSDRIAYSRIGNELSRMGGTGLEPVTPSVSCDLGDTHRTRKPLVFQAILCHSHSLPFSFLPLKQCHGSGFRCQTVSKRLAVILVRFGVFSVKPSSNLSPICPIDCSSLFWFAPKEAPPRPPQGMRK